MSVRTHGRWMTWLDERVLEYLDAHDLATPQELARAVQRPVTVRRVHERLRVLSQASYVAPLDDDYDTYELARWGRRYLDGRVRADCLVPVPSPARSGHVLG